MFHNTQVKRPSQRSMLHKALFESRTDESVLKIISSGILALCENARRLLDDAKILTNADRFSAACFLLATADEEAAKVYILLDMARLDFAKHQGELGKLCKAFYNHLSKHAYIETTRFNRLWDMAHLKKVVEMEKVEWFKGNYESGEPDMPAQALMVREGSLYVDFSDYDDAWFTPSWSKEMVLGWGSEEGRIGGALAEVEGSVRRLEETRDAGLFSLECLQIFHGVFSQVFITSNTTNKELKALYDHFLKRLEEQGIHLSETLRNDNALLEWPLYSLM